LNQLPLEEKFQRVAVALAKIKNPADRVRLGFKLFDSEGVALINTAELIANRMEDIRAETKRLGLELNAWDITRIAEAKDSLTRLKAVITGVLQKITVLVSPFITAAIDALVRMGTEGVNMGDIIKMAMDKAAIAAAFLARTIAGVSTAYQAVVASVAFLALKDAEITMILAEELMLQIRKSGSTQADTLVSASLKYFEAVKEFRRLQALASGDFEALSDMWADLGADKAFEDFLAQYREFQELQEKIRKNRPMEASPKPGLLGGDGEGMKKRLAQLKSMAAGIITATRTPMEKFIQQMQELQELLRLGKDKGGIGAETFRRAIKGAREELDKAREPDARRASKFQQIRSLSSVAVGGASKTDNALAKRDRARDKILEGVRKAILEMRDRAVRLQFD